MDQNLLQEQHEKDIRDLMETPGGRRVMWWVLEEVGGLYGKSYQGNAEHAVHVEGRRSVAIEVMRELQYTAPKSFRIMMDEGVIAEEEARQDLLRAQAKAAKEASDENG